MTVQIKQVRPHGVTKAPTPIDLPFAQNKSSRSGRSGVEGVVGNSGKDGKEGTEGTSEALDNAGSGSEPESDVASFSKSDKSGMEGTVDV